MQILKYSYCQVLLFTILLLVIITAWNVSKSVRIWSYSGPNFCPDTFHAVNIDWLKQLRNENPFRSYQYKLSKKQIWISCLPCQCQFRCFYDLKNQNCWNALRITIYCCKLFRTLLSLYRAVNDGGILLYVGEDIPSKCIKGITVSNSFQVLFI